MNEVFLSLGCNVGDRAENLKKAIELLDWQGGKVVLRSGVYETEPWGCDTRHTFYNQVIKLETLLEPMDLLAVMQKIETRLGRDHAAPRFADREMDIDILIYDGLIVKMPELIIPHPFIHTRRFVLVPFAEIAPNTGHPVFHTTIADLLSLCTDEAKILRKVS